MQTKHRFTFLVTSFIFFTTLHLHAQNKDADNVIARCQSIIDGSSATPESFAQLITASTNTLNSSKGLSRNQLCRLNYFAGVSYYNLHKFDSARYFFEACNREAVIAGNGDIAAYALGSLVNIYNYLGIDDKSDSTAQLLQAVLDTTKNNKTLSIGYYALGNFYVKARSFFNLGLSELLLGLKALKPIIDTSTSVKNKIYHNAISIAIADIYYSLKQYEKSLQYLYDTRKYASLSLPTKLGFTCRLVKNYAALKNIDSALFYHNQLEEFVADAPGKWSEPISSNLAIFFYYLGENKNVLAKKYLDSAVAKANETGVVVMISGGDAAQGEYYFKQKDYLTAKKYFERSVDPMYSVDKDAYCNIRKKLAEIALNLGNTEEAKKQMNLYSSATDSLVDEKVSKNLAEMEAVYQNNDKRKQLVVQESELQFAGKQRLWLISGITAMALLAILLFAFYRNKKKNAEALAKINAQLEEANNTKAKLFGIISHDLRSPISQVHQFLKLQQLNPQSLSETQRTEFSNKIQTATGSLLETMEDLLMWSKTQLNEFNTSMELVNLFDVANTCQQLLQLNIDSKHLQVQNTVSKETAAYSDSYFLQTIFRNLLQNAVKASPEGEKILIAATKNNTAVELSISNSGNSFTQEQYESIVKTNTDSKTLNGLGLHLVDELSKKIAATINYTVSENDKITTVKITLPLNSSI
ncbi:MAG: HAMP domain-containing sensor histidine kinase [Ferruginibacter sp.]